MSAKTIKGKKIAAGILSAARKQISGLDATPGLAAVLIGDDPASHLYVRLKEEACREVGVRFEKVLLSAEASEKEVLAAISALNFRRDIDAMIVQLPLPPHLDEERIIAAIDPEKDADGFHQENLKLLKEGRPRVIPGLARGILELIKSTGVKMAGKNITVIANSRTFFEPLEIVFAREGSHSTFIMPDDAKLESFTSEADILVVAAGKQGLIGTEMIKPGAVIIDVGTNKKGKTVIGDVDPAAKDIAGHVTPVPGGVGPVTVAMLIRNTVVLAEKRVKK